MGVCLFYLDSCKMVCQIGVEKIVFLKLIVLVVKREIVGIIKFDIIIDGLICELRIFGEYLIKWKGKYLI